MALLSRVLMLDRGRGSSADLAHLRKVFGQVSRSATYSNTGPEASPDMIVSLLTAMYELANPLSDDLANRIADFFCSPGNMKVLVQVLCGSYRGARPLDHQQSDKSTRRSAARELEPHHWVVSVYLSNGAPRLREAIAISEFLLNKLLAAVVRPPEHFTETQMDQIARVISAVLSEKPASFTKIVASQHAEFPEIVPALVSHVGVPTVSTLLAKMVSEQEFGRSDPLSFGKPNRRTIVLLAQDDVMRLLGDSFAHAAVTWGHADSNNFQEIKTMEASLRTLVAITMRALVVEKKEELHDHQIEVFAGDTAPSVFNRSVDSLNSLRRPGLLVELLDTVLRESGSRKDHPALPLALRAFSDIFRALVAGRKSNVISISKMSLALNTKDIVDAVTGRLPSLLLLSRAKGKISSIQRIAVAEFVAAFIALDGNAVWSVTTAGFALDFIDLVGEFQNSSVLHRYALDAIQAVFEDSNRANQRAWLADLNLKDLSKTKMGFEESGIAFPRRTNTEVFWHEVGKVLYQHLSRLSVQGDFDDSFKCAVNDFLTLCKDLFGDTMPWGSVSNKPRTFNSRLSNEQYVGEDAGERMYIAHAIHESQLEHAKHEVFPLTEVMLPIVRHGKTHGARGAVFRKRQPHAGFRPRRSLPEDSVAH